METLRTWSGWKHSSHKLGPLCAVGLSSAAARWPSNWRRRWEGNLGFVSEHEYKPDAQAREFVRDLQNVSLVRDLDLPRSLDTQFRDKA